MRLYLGGAWVAKSLMHAAHGYMRERGFEVVSTWTEQPDDADGTCTSEERVYYAQRDWAELCSADTLVYCAFGGVKSEGKATELGAALMAGKRVLLVGKRDNNLFLHLPAVEQYDALRFAADALRVV